MIYRFDEYELDLQRYELGCAAPAMWSRESPRCLLRSFT
jgi:hypothetical protein